jgi:hypothetical protein
MKLELDRSRSDCPGKPGGAGKGCHCGKSHAPGYEPANRIRSWNASAEASVFGLITTLQWAAQSPTKEDASNPFYSFLFPAWAIVRTALLFAFLFLPFDFAHSVSSGNTPTLFVPGFICALKRPTLISTEDPSSSCMKKDKIATDIPKFCSNLVQIFMCH